jgi:transposase
MRNTPYPSRVVAPRHNQRLSPRATLLQNRSVCFVLLPKRWVVERGFAWAARYRRLAHDYERLATTLAGLRFLAFACLMLHRFTLLI